MQRPLRFRIMVPMIGILIITVTMVSALNAWLASARVKRQLENQIADVSRTLASTTFPLQSNVLRYMRGLTSADYVVIDSDGRAVAASDDSLTPLAEQSNGPPMRLSAVMGSDGRNLFSARIPVDRQASDRGKVTLHVFYSAQALSEARWQAAWPPLAIGALSIVLMAAVVTLTAKRVTRPLQVLHEQVEQIAKGDFRPMAVPQSQDEVRGLAIAVNDMGKKLMQYEAQIRASERMKALATLGGGIAHQIRNAATGCRIALDLHQRDCPAASATQQSGEPLSVAVRQLAQIELSVQRLLTLGKPQAGTSVRTDLVAMTQDAMELVRPLVTHMHVGLTVELPSHPQWLPADPHSITQMILNLLVNAVEAASKAAGGTQDKSASTAGRVEVRLVGSGHGYELSVGNTGPGPSKEMQPRLFEPFATDKPGGTGLGLAVARRIAEDHAGSIRWEQRDGVTWFFVFLPASR